MVSLIVTVTGSGKAIFEEFCLLIFRLYVSACTSLYRVGAPSWLVNAPAFFVPAFVRQTGARVWLDRHPERKT